MRLHLLSLAAVLLLGGCDLFKLQKVSGPTTPAPAPIAVPAAAKKYICPMKCEGSETSDPNGTCPMCKMKVVEKT